MGEELFECPRCSTLHRLSDYRSDVVYIYCSRCKEKILRAQVKAVNLCQPTLPIFISDESGDIAAYKTVEHAELHLEAIDVENGEYVGYDAEGRVLTLCTFGEVVRIWLFEKSEQRTTELAQKLCAYLKAVNDPRGDTPSLDLSSLVSYWKKFR